MKKCVYLLCLSSFLMIPVSMVHAAKGSAKEAGGASFKVLCQNLPDYQGDADAGVEYQPGVDVHGNAVAPADLNAPLDAGAGRVVQIPVTVDLVQRFNLYPFFGIEMKPDVGVVSVHSDGRVEYNGQNLTRQAYTLCGRDTKIILPPDGQSLTGDVNSAVSKRGKR